MRERAHLLIGRMMSQGAYMQKEQVEALRSALSDAFGEDVARIARLCGAPL